MTPNLKSSPFPPEGGEIPIGHGHSNDEVIAMWLHDKSVNTQEMYRRVVYQFLEAVGKPIQWVTLGDIQAYADQLVAAGLKPPTRATYLAALKSLFSFCSRSGLTRANVGAAVSLPKGKDAIAQRILLKEEVMAIIYSEPDNRNRLIFKTFYYCGLRVSELCALKWHDLVPSGESGILTVFGKRDKTRHVLLPPGLYRELVESRGSALDDHPIFASRKTKGHLDRSHVTYIVKQAGLRVGVSSKVSSHWLRHCHASHSLDAGAPISLVQQTLGHSSVATTSKYLHAKPNDSSGLYL